MCDKNFLVFFKAVLVKSGLETLGGPRRVHTRSASQPKSKTKYTIYGMGRGSFIVWN